MISQGLVLALVGMGVVFIFLFLLVLIVRGTSLICVPDTAREFKEVEDQRAKAARKRLTAPHDRGRLIAAITTAVAAFRAARKNG